MLKRIARLGLICALALSIASVAVAQQTPVPVVRMGDWIEIGDDAWMNITGNIDMRAITTHNFDFEDDIQDLVPSRNPNSSTVTGGILDGFEAETRWGADFRFGKKLSTRVLWETQGVYDGNLIDDRGNANAPAEPDRGIAAGGLESVQPHVERFWIDYKWTDQVRTRFGADLWRFDPMGLLGDDDPRFAIYLTPSPDLEFVAQIVIQSESSRLGLMNDNDDMYYAAAATYRGMKGHQFQLAAAYYRFRFDPSETADTFMITPSWEGTAGIIRGVAQIALNFGEVEGRETAAGLDDGIDYDVFSWGFWGGIEVNLGTIRPFVTVVYGSGDDDANDTDLQGFNHFPQGEISLGNRGLFGYGNWLPGMGPWGPQGGARSPLGGGANGESTTGNLMANAIGNAAHSGTVSDYSNAGTLRIGIGVNVAPFKGHTGTLVYQYLGVVDDATILGHQAALGAAVAFPRTSFDETLYHTIGAAWFWTVNRHFDFRFSGTVHLPGDGTKDIASTVDCGGVPCEGEDIAVRGEIRVRAMF